MRRNVTYSFDPEIIALIDDLSKRLKTSKSEAVRRALFQFVPVVHEAIAKADARCVEALSWSDSQREALWKLIVDAETKVTK